MAMRAVAARCVLGALVGWGCGSDAGASPDSATPDTANDTASHTTGDTFGHTTDDTGSAVTDLVTADSAVTDLDVSDSAVAEASGDADADTDVDADAVAATQYCEAIVDSFCAYYLRCGRMAVPDRATCRFVFLETCNARYEPLWVDLVARERLALSAPGIAECAAHVADVRCAEQIFDLDGACQGMWRGRVPAGGTCGPGLASFVCDPSTTCVIGLDLCGECVPLAAPGAICDLDHRCPVDATCQDGACVPRALPGAPCDDQTTCVLGAVCEAGTCQGDAIVQVGEPCDDRHACPYKALCTSTPAGARCVESHLLGEPCGDGVGCASGWCDGGTCAPLGAAGDRCTSPGACVSGRCTDGACAPIALIGPTCGADP